MNNFWLMTTKEDELMNYLSEKVFNPILNSTKSSTGLKQGVRYTIMRLKERNAEGMLNYYWSAISGTDRSIGFAKQMKKEGFTRFEEILEEFREKFDDNWLRK